MNAVDLGANQLWRLSPLEYKAFFTVLAKLPALYRLGLADNLKRYEQGNRNDYQRLNAIGENLAQLPNLVALDLSSNNLDSLPANRWKILGQSLPAMKNLTVLNVRNNHLGGLSLEQWQAFLLLLKKSQITRLIIAPTDELTAHRVFVLNQVIKNNIHRVQLAEAVPSLRYILARFIWKNMDNYAADIKHKLPDELQTLIHDQKKLGLKIQ